MVVKRIAALALVLLTGACARFPSVPTAYSALPPLAAAGRVTAPAILSPASPTALSTASAAPAVIIPGTPTASRAEGRAQGRAQGVNPTAVLETSMRTRMAWEPLHPGDLLMPPAARSRTRLAGGDVAGGEAAEARAGVPLREAAPPVLPHPYDRDAAMNRLLKRSVATVSTICSGC